MLRMRLMFQMTRKFSACWGQVWGRALLTSTHTDTQCDGLAAVPEIKLFRAGKRTKAEKLLFPSSPKSGFAAYTSNLISVREADRRERLSKCPVKLLG